MQRRRDLATTDPQRAALSALISAYAGPLTRFFSRRVRVAADVPDLMQEVFLRLSRMEHPGRSIRFGTTFRF